MNLSHLLFGIFSFISVASASQSFHRDVAEAVLDLNAKYPEQQAVTGYWSDSENPISILIFQNMVSPLKYDPKHLSCICGHTIDLMRNHPEMPLERAVCWMLFLKQYAELFNMNYEDIRENNPTFLVDGCKSIEDLRKMSKDLSSAFLIVTGDTFRFVSVGTYLAIDQLFVKAYSDIYRLDQAR